MNWNNICADSTLKDLPYKIELDEWGQVTMSPASIKHVVFQDTIATLLKKLMREKGRSLQEFPIAFGESVKVPDVVWISEPLFQEIKEQVISQRTPEICVEIMSPSNSRKHILIKRDIYLQRGAKEFWLCTEEGHIEFYAQSGELSQSLLCVDFPKYITI